MLSGCMDILMCECWKRRASRGVKCVGNCRLQTDRIEFSLVDVKVKISARSQTTICMKKR